MKKFARFIICFVVIAAQYIMPVKAAPEPQNPADAVAQLMESIKNFDVSEIHSPDTGGDIFSALIEAAVAPVLAKLDYEIGNTRVTDNRAVADISVTVADIGDSAALITKQAAGLAIIGKVLGVDIDIIDFIIGRVKDELREENLTTIKTDATVYMIMGGDGKWKLDLSDERNLDFLKALSGGAADLEEPVRKLLAKSDQQ